MSIKVRSRNVEVPVTILAIDSSYDPITEIISEYRENNVYPYFVESGFFVEECRGRLARRHFVVDAL